MEFEEGLTFSQLDNDIARAIKCSVKKYESYYTRMDEDSDIHYAASVLDPRVKSCLITQELADERAANDIIDHLRQNFHDEYPVPSAPRQETPQLPEDGPPAKKKPRVGSSMLRRLRPQVTPVQLTSSDIDQYFD